MMQWQRLTPRSFADALAVLAARHWWLGVSVDTGSKPAAEADTATPPPTQGRPSPLAKLRRPF